MNNMDLDIRRLPRFFLALVLATVAMPAVAQDFKIATLLPDGTLWMQEMRKGADEIQRRTEGRVIFKYYPGGSMGSDRNVLRKIRAGQLHGGMLTGGSLADIHTDAQIYSLPFLFRSYEEVEYVRARMDKTIAQSLLDRGFVTFGFSHGGFAYIMSNAPTRRVDDLRNQKVWIPEGDDLSRAIFENLGISPIPLPLTDMLTGLQTGLITTVASSAVGAIALQWHTKVRFVTDLPTLYLYGSLAIDKKAYGRMTAADQGVVREVMEKIYHDLNQQNRLDDQNAHQALRKQGIEYVSMAPEETAKLRKAADETLERLGKQGMFSLALLRTARDHLEAFRRQPPAKPR